MIIDIRGTNGAGKSYIPHRIMQEHGPAEHEKSWVHVPSLNLSFVGRYATQCGGCDAMPNQEAIQDVAREQHALGRHVILEGLLVSGLYSRYEAFAREMKDDYVFAFLDTPWEKCVERVLQRRAAKGNDKPFDPNRTMWSKFRAVNGARDKLVAAGRRVLVIDHEHSYEQIMMLLRGEIK